MMMDRHIEIYSKNKFENLVHLVGFIIRIYHYARSPERQILSSLHAEFKINIFAVVLGNLQLPLQGKH